MSSQHVPTFTKFSESTKQDWDNITELYKRTQGDVANQVLEQLQKLDGELDGYPVTRLEHSLQTATRAECDGQSMEYVMCALLHDIGDSLAPDNHEAVAAAIIKPFVSEAHHWMVAHHGIFQGYYFWQHIGLNQHARDSYTDNPHYQLAADFCAKYDQISFDPTYESHTLNYYEPHIRSFFHC
jgi:predicted HD phosphohydrolase